MSEYSFKDNSGLSIWLRRFLWFSIVVLAVCIVSDILERLFLQDIENGRYFIESELNVAANQNDIRQGILTLLATLMFFISGVTLLRWVYFSAQNALVMNPDEMHYTPGWAIAWFLIPVASIWMPILVVRRLFSGSTTEAAGVAQKTFPVVTWWLQYLISSSLITLSNRQMESAEAMEEIYLANTLSIGSEIFGIIFCLMTMKLITRLNFLQSAFDPLSEVAEPAENTAESTAGT